MGSRVSRHRPDLLWSVGTTAMPAFIDDGVQTPYRPTLAAVVNGQGLVIGHGVSSREDPHSGVLVALRQAMGEPLQGFGSGSRPEAILVAQAELRPVVERLLPGVPVRVGRSSALDDLFRTLPEIAAEDQPRGLSGLRSYLTADITPEAVGSFFAACQGLGERRPWTQFADDQCLFTVTSQALAMRRWCGCVIGQAGESYGVLLFQSRQEQSRFIEAAQRALQTGAPTSGLFPHQWAINFEPFDSLAPELCREIESHGWPVAAGDAFPVPLHVDPDLVRVPLTRDDLARLEAVARALTRLIDNVPDLADYWNWCGQEPLRRQFRVPVQDRGVISMSIGLVPPEDEDEEDRRDPPMIRGRLR